MVLAVVFLTGVALGFCIGGAIAEYFYKLKIERNKDDGRRF